MKSRLWRFLAIFALVGGSILDQTPARALGIPQIEVVEPLSPALAGVCIVVRVKIDWDDSYGSMHVRFADEGWQESSETQFERVFCTGKYEPGTYKIRAEARNKSDNSWSSPTVAEVDFTLLSLSEMIPPGTVAYYGTLRQTYDAKIGNDLYHFQGGAVLDYNSQRWLVPNDQTAAALCISEERLNPWSASDADLSSTPRGPDIPDIITQPEAFWKTRNEYFPYCNWTPDGGGTIEQPGQQAQQPVTATPTQVDVLPSSSTSEVWSTTVSDCGVDPYIYEFYKDKNNQLKLVLANSTGILNAIQNFFSWIGFVIDVGNAKFEPTADEVKVTLLYSNTGKYALKVDRYLQGVLLSSDTFDLDTSDYQEYLNNLNSCGIKS